jgi:hypothetical protein
LGVASRAQVLSYGRAALPGENPLFLDLPLYLLIPYLPLALISDADLARAIWAALGQAAVAAMILPVLAVIQWQAPRAFVLAFSPAAVLSLYSVEALTDGTPVLLLTLAYMGVLWSLYSGRDELAGAILALTLFKWEVGIVFLCLVAWRIAHEGRWRVFAGLGMTLTILLAVAFLLYPGWVLPYWVAVIGMMRSAYSPTSYETLARLWPEHGEQLARGVTIAVLALLLLEWAVSRNSDFRRFVWLACLALAATPLLGMPTTNSSQVVLLPAFVLVAAAGLRRRQPGPALAILLLTLAFAVPWILFWRAASFQDQRVQDIQMLYLPCLTILGLYWTRWWFNNPRRTWLDEIRNKKS